MQKIDLIITYTENMASSPAEADIKTPFNSNYDAYNNLYSFFLLECSRVSISAAFSTSKDIIGSGRFSSFWTYKNNNWVKNNEEGTSNLLYMRFTPTNLQQKEKLKVLLSDPRIKAHPPQALTNIFKDKLETYKKFKWISLPTVKIGSFTEENFSKAKLVFMKLIKNCENHIDFSNHIVIKDQFGSSGENVIKAKINDSFSKINTQLKKENTSGNEISYLMQAYVDASNTIPEEKGKASDLRTVFLNGKIVDCYGRVARRGEFRSNFHQGAKRLYFENPESAFGDILSVAKKLSKQMDMPHTLFSLDFVKSTNGNVYLIEANSAPSLDWDKYSEKRQKELIRVVVGELKKLISKMAS